MFKPQVYKSRREHLRKLLGEGVYLFLGNNESPMNYRDNTYHFRQDSTFLYFFGLDLPGMAAIIDVDNNKEIIFANDVDIDDIIWMGPQQTVKGIVQKCLVFDTIPFSKLSDYLKETLKKKRKVHFLPPYRHENMILLNDLLG
ncbi:MAG: aminopeptidase P N-terminal domain-containing protein, partial [Bacteroidales bacterium]|nr:aminopeptidase P N-terminal domain-containing protein [Bacteroidales bacterium]